MKHKNLKLSLVMLVFGLTIQAQQRATATGGNAIGSGGSSSYSVGLVDYKTSIGSGGSSAQGLQHAYEIFTLGVQNPIALKIEIFVFPNPTTNSVNLEIGDISSGQLSYQLFDMNGRLLKQNSIDDNQTQISMENWSSATYIMHVTQGNKKIKSFKIIKK